MRAALLRTTFAALLGFAVVSLSVHASTAGQASKPDSTLTTIVGCLVNENPNNPSNAAAGGVKTNDFFVRTPTIVLPPGATVAIGTPGTTSTATSAGKPAGDSYYRITGMSADQLRVHLGHRVEVQGHLSATKPNAAPGGMTTTKTTVDAAGKPKVTVETRVDVAGDLHATALKMVSADCK